MRGGASCEDSRGELRYPWQDLTPNGVRSFGRKRTWPKIMGDDPEEHPVTKHQSHPGGARLASIAHTAYPQFKPNLLKGQRRRGSQAPSARPVNALPGVHP